MRIKLNPDKKIVKEIRQKLKENNGYCPCSCYETADFKCMCKAFREQEETGPCHCGLYIKEDNEEN